MKKTSKNVDVKGEAKIDYFKLRQETPSHLRKGITMKEFHEAMRKANKEKLELLKSQEVQK
jgi:hypothetical protein